MRMFGALLGPPSSTPTRSYLAGVSLASKPAMRSNRTFTAAAADGARAAKAVATAASTSRRLMADSLHQTSSGPGARGARGRLGATGFRRMEPFLRHRLHPHTRPHARELQPELRIRPRRDAALHADHGKLEAALHGDRPRVHPHALAHRTAPVEHLELHHLDGVSDATLGDTCRP